jgi:hypothetical protein
MLADAVGDAAEAEVGWEYNLGAVKQLDGEDGGELQWRARLEPEEATVLAQEIELHAQQARASGVRGVRMVGGLWCGCSALEELPGIYGAGVPPQV